MTKLIITYFFSFILLVSIVTPAYMNLINESCEISVVENLGEEEEKKGKESSLDLELKIYYTHDNSGLYVNLEKKKRVSFFLENYAFNLNRLNNPPPEFTLS